MNWKKLIKYTLLFLLIAGLLFSYGFYRLGEQIYGGLTEKVDPSQFTPVTGPFLIRNVSVLSPDGETMIAHRDVKIDQGKIIRIDSSGSNTEGIHVIDGKGKYLIPGLIDAHVHLFKSPNDLLLYIANGVTQVRELIGESDHLKWKEEIEQGRIGPELFVASPRLGSFEGMEGLMMEQTQGYINISTAEEARKMVKKLHTEGYDGLKIYSQMNRESYLALTATAKELNMPYFGHIPWELELSEIWENGQHGIAHFEELMNALQRDFDPQHNGVFGSFYRKEESFLDYVSEQSGTLAEHLLKNEITVTSTLWLTQSFVRQKFELDQVLREVELEYQNPGISEWVDYIPQGLGWLPQVNRYKMADGLSPEKQAQNKRYWETYGEACKVLAKRLSEMGVKIMAGTDANLPPAVPGFSLHDELVALTEAGMSPADALRAATVVPAEWLGSNTGVVDTGYQANLVLLNENPLEDIANTKSILAVISKGRVLDRVLLDAILKEVKIANDQSRNVPIDEFKRQRINRNFQSQII